MLRKIFVTLLILPLYAGIFAPSVFAREPGTFPSCTAPSGELKVSYANGLHGIPGRANYEGSDAVYTVDQQRVLQCFCPSVGSGIQTNWWAVPEMTVPEIQSYEQAGWYYVPNGAGWGLDPVGYLTLSFDYNCHPESNSSNGGPWSAPGPGSAPVCNSQAPVAPRLYSVDRRGSSAVLRWTRVDQADHYTIYYGTTPNQYQYSVVDTGNVDNYTINALDPNQTYYFSVRGVNNCMPGAASSDSAGQILGASTGEILGLAGTGNTPSFYLSLAIAASTLFLAGIIFRRHATV